MRGQVRRGGADTTGTVPLAGQWVVLHRVDRVGGAPIDSQRTGADGRFGFRITDTDSASIYFVGTAWQEIAYLTQPVIGNQLPDTTETLVVWDTTRTGPPITVAQRHVITRTPGPAGHRRVLELLVLEHRGAGTRVGTGADGPVWAGRLPDGATDFEVGESDMSAEAVRAVDGEVWVLAPIPPGQRQLLYTYVLPGSASTMTLTLNQPVEQLTMLFEDTAAAVVSGPVADRGIEIFEDAQFRMFDGIVAGPGTTITVRYNRPRALGEGMLAALIVGAVVVGGVLIVLLRRRRRPPAADEDATALARQIAALDAEFERRAQPTAVERARYEKHRSKLKARLDQVIERV